jgi:DNA-binding response OmpR family regulator
MDIARNMQEKSSSLPSSSESSSYSCGSDKRIFLVDDETDQTLSFKIGLENSGFKVDAFNDPEEALSNFKTGTYDLLLLDVRMPKMNGFQLYEELEKIDDKAKVCFITAFEVYYRSLREVFPDIKIDCFIKKPIDMEELVKKVRYELQ